MDLHGFTWIYMDYMDLHGFTWIYMDLHEFKWIYMDLHGFTRDLHEFTWIYIHQAARGNLRKTVEKWKHKHAKHRGNELKRRSNNA